MLEPNQIQTKDFYLFKHIICIKTRILYDLQIHKEAIIFMNVV